MRLDDLTASAHTLIERVKIVFRRVNALFSVSGVEEPDYLTTFYYGITGSFAVFSLESARLVYPVVNRVIAYPKKPRYLGLAVPSVKGYFR